MKGNKCISLRYISYKHFLLAASIMCKEVFFFASIGCFVVKKLTARTKTTTLPTSWYAQLYKSFS